MSPIWKIIAVATGHFISNYLLAVAYRALGFGSHFMLKYPDDCCWGFCGLQLRNWPQDGTFVSGWVHFLKSQIVNIVGFAGPGGTIKTIM